MAAVAVLPRMRAHVKELPPESGRAFLQDCFSCHSTTRRTANLAIEELNVERVSENPEIWEKVVRRLRTGLHPPAGVPRPSGASIDAFCGSVEAGLGRPPHANWAPGGAG